MLLARRPSAASGGFTLVELLIVVFLLIALMAMAYPHLDSAIDQSNYIGCESRLQQIKRAKTAYVIDHLGQGSPVDPEDQAVFRAYFPEQFTSFSCPRSPETTYTSVYHVYRASTCPYCETHRGTARLHEEP